LISDSKKLLVYLVEYFDLISSKNTRFFADCTTGGCDQEGKLIKSKYET